MITILGAGLAGLSAAFHLQKAGRTDVAVFEKGDRVGGTCCSEYVDGFTFDYTGHFLHFVTEDVKTLVLEIMGGNLHSLERDSWIFSHNVFTPYPFQQNTYGLPVEVVKECIVGLIEAKHNGQKNGVEVPKDRSMNFKEWIDQTFGRGIAKHFMVPYNEKLWTVPVEELTCAWMGRFIPQPSIEDVIEGALSRKPQRVGYNAKLWYPVKGGIEALPRAFASRLHNVTLNREAVEIDVKRKAVRFKDGSETFYERLVSTMPMKQLVRIMKGAPSHVREAAERLRNNSVINVNFGIANRNVTEKHWIYFPERNYRFYRAGFPHNFSPYQVPSGCSSVNVEISYSGQRPIDYKEAIQLAKEDLIRADILKTSDKIVVEKCLEISCAYVIYDKNHVNIVDTIQNYLREQEIYSIGRYGAWEYSSMEDAIVHGRKAAEKLLEIPKA
jgi:protoporphyrinogen oxidase